jgi:hypothetical protein
VSVSKMLGAEKSFNKNKLIIIMGEGI